MPRYLARKRIFKPNYIDTNHILKFNERIVHSDNLDLIYEDGISHHDTANTTETTIKYQED
jgi:hypothetical protein